MTNLVLALLIALFSALDARAGLFLHCLGFRLSGPFDVLVSRVGPLRAISRRRASGLINSRRRFLPLDASALCTSGKMSSASEAKLLIITGIINYHKLLSPHDKLSLS